MKETESDIAIIGAGAAGLAAAIFAGEAARSAARPVRICLLDGAVKPGAKILISGGGRCNVTNERVTPGDFNGGPRPLIRNVLRAFDERATLQWMERLGVRLKLEPTGKYFPVTDQAQTVLAGLMNRAREVGVILLAGTRVTEIVPASAESPFVLKAQSREKGKVEFTGRRLIVATGGLALPKSGSDGAGVGMMELLGHTVIPVTPALVPLVLEPGPDVGGRFAEFSGLTLNVRIGLYRSGEKPKHETSGSLLFTHFGISGPAPLDFSRHWLRAKLDEPEVPFEAALSLVPFKTTEETDQWLRDQAASNPRRAIATLLAEWLPEALARAMTAGLENTTAAHLGRAERRELARRLVRLPIRVRRDRGYSFAETSAGGIDLREVDTSTMQSRKVPGLFICGEMLDVDGRIGGFNFQWAWASGYLAGRGAVASLAP